MNKIITLLIVILLVLTACDFFSNSILNDEIKKVVSPVFNIQSGTYTDAQEIIISCETADAKIYYTLDGTVPTMSSKLYSASFKITSTTNLKAIAICDGYVDSDIAERNYSIVGIEGPINTLLLSKQGSFENMGDLYFEGSIRETNIFIFFDINNIYFYELDESGIFTLINSYQLLNEYRTYEWSESKVWIDDGLVFIIPNSSAEEMEIVDISNLDGTISSVLLSLPEHNDSFGTMNISLQDEYMYYTCTSGLYIYNISDINNISQDGIQQENYGESNYKKNFKDIIVEGDYAYTITSTISSENIITLYDISGIDDITELSHAVTLPPCYYLITKSNDYLYAGKVVYSPTGDITYFYVFDVSDPVDPSLIYECEVDQRVLEVTDNYIMCEDGIYLKDFTENGFSKDVESLYKFDTGEKSNYIIQSIELNNDTVVIYDYTYSDASYYDREYNMSVYDIIFDE